MALYRPLSQVVLGGSSTAPPASGVGTDPGAYNGFPQSATNGTKTVAVWAHSRNHAGSPASFCQFATQPTPNGAWSTPATMWDDTTANVGVTPVGLTFMPARGSFAASWICLALRTTYAGSSITARAARLVTSPDAATWTPGSADPFTGMGFAWYYAADLKWFDDGTDAGQLWASAYGAYAAAPAAPSRPILVLSLDRGATWTHVGSPYGTGTDWIDGDGNDLGPVPTGLAEPIIYVDKASPYPVGVVWRSDGDRVFRRSNVIHQAGDPWSSVTWTIPWPVVPGVSGEPNLFIAQDGSWHLFARDMSKDRGDGVHAPWGWWTASSGAGPWTAMGDFTGTGKSAMYASITPVTGGGFLVVHAEEDGAAWGPCSVYATAFVAAATTVTVKYDGVPRVEIGTSFPGDVWRNWTNRRGDQVSEQVRLSTGNGTLWTDYEAPQGVSVWYSTPAGDTSPVRVRETEGSAWLVHPSRPELSVQVTLKGIGDQARKLDVTEVAVAGRANPVTITQRPRGGQRFTLIVKTEDLAAADALDELLDDGSPLFLATSPRHNLPAWVRITDTTAAKFWEYIDEQRRNWQLPCVEVDRPTAIALPDDYRVRDLYLPVKDLTAAVGDGLMPN